MKKYILYWKLLKISSGELDCIMNNLPVIFFLSRNIPNDNVFVTPYKHQNTHNFNSAYICLNKTLIRINRDGTNRMDNGSFLSKFYTKYFGDECKKLEFKLDPLLILELGIDSDSLDTIKLKLTIEESKLG